VLGTMWLLQVYGTTLLAEGNPHWGAAIGVSWQ
jgi:hypothetical protein